MAGRAISRGQEADRMLPGTIEAGQAAGLVLGVVGMGAGDQQSQRLS
jgi:hypothetical protein